MIPDPFRKTVKIPVRITEGHVIQMDGTALPKLADGAIGDLVLNAHDIEEKEILKTLNTEKTIEILPKDSWVYMGVSRSVVPGEKQAKLKLSSDLGIFADYGFVEVRLTEALKMRLRGAKAPVLLPCECQIPSLGDRKASSLNHAFTIVSTEFETKRISHTGNVFQRVYAKCGKDWRCLNELRGFPAE